MTSIAGLHIIEFDCRKFVCDPKAVREYNRLRSLHIPHLGPTDTHWNAQKSGMFIKPGFRCAT